MRLAFVLLIATCVIRAWTQASDAPDENRPRPSRRAFTDGFVVCSAHEETVPTYFNPCHTHPSGTLSCGEKVGVMTRSGDMLRVRLADGFPRYAPSSAISQRPDQMVPFGEDSAVPDHGAFNCAQQPDRNVTPPRATYSPAPEFSEEARKRKVAGTVLLSVTVGVDGVPHDIKVEKGIGYGLDEKAVEAVSRWKFDPALKDGQPIEKQIKVEVSFNLMK
jgi:TonB family protein